MCDLCRQYPCHPRCPNYIPPKTTYYCSICNEEIYKGERYIENFNSDLAHWDCIFGMSDLVDFMDIEIKEMEKDNEEDY